MVTGPLSPPPDQFSAPRADQVRELLQFLREENAANREAVRLDGDSSRALLQHTLQLVAVPVTIGLAIAGFFGWRSLDSFKESLQTELRAEARRQTDAEISRMQEEVRQRIGDQFQTPTIQKVVADAAVRATASSADLLIRSQVEKEVKNRVAAEQGAINRAVVEQTGAAVRAMTPQIESLVKSSVDARVENEVEPVVRQVSGLTGEFYRIRTLSAKVDFVFPLDSPPTIQMLPASVYIWKKESPVAEFGVQMGGTRVENPRAGELLFSTTQELYPPFLALISKPINSLDGADSLSVEFLFAPDELTKPGAYDAVKRYFDRIKEIRVQFSINGVPFDAIGVNGSEFTFPKDSASLAVEHGAARFSIRHSLSSSPFRDTKKEYNRLTAMPGTAR